VETRARDDVQNLSEGISQTYLMLAPVSAVNAARESM
jgi:hypothetical protein